MIFVVVGISILIALVSLRVNVVLAAPFAVMFIAVTNGIHPLQMLTGPYIEGVVHFMQQFLFIILLGSIFGSIMDQSGAAFRIGSKLELALGSKRAATAVFAASFLLGLGGIAGYVIIFTMYPLGLAVFEKANLPRRLLLACIGAGVGMSIAAPGTPQVQNLMPMEYLNTSPIAGFWLGMVGLAFASVLIVIYLEKQAARAREREEVFTRPQSYVMRQVTQGPPLWLCCLPLVAVITLLSVVRLNPLVALAGGVAAAFVLLYTYLSSPLATLNMGTQAALMPLLFAASSVGFGLALKSVPSFMVFIELIANSSWDSLLLAGIISNLASGMMGSASGGVVLTLTTVGGELSAGTDPALLHRVITFASIGLDTMPHCNGYLTMLVVSGMTLRETYKEYFVVTVLAPLAGLALMLALIRVGVFT